MVHRMYHDVYWTKLPIVKTSSNLALVLCFVLCSPHVLVWVLGSIAARMQFPTKCVKILVLYLIRKATKHDTRVLGKKERRL